MPICPHAEARSPQGSWLYLLERFDVGVVHLDSDLHVIGMNDYARRSLPVQQKLPFGKVVTSFHPEGSRAKVEFLLGQAECPVSNAPPMTMIINIPERVLLIKVSKIGNEQGVTQGYTLVFYDITEVVAKDDEGVAQESRERPAKRQLLKIPTMKANRVVLVDVPTVSFVRSEGHYTWIHAGQASHFCNLNIGDLEGRLDPQVFLRVHRSYIVNLTHVDEIVRDDGRVTLRMMGPAPVDIPVSRTSVPRLMEQLGLAEGAATQRG